MPAQPIKPVFVSSSVSGKSITVSWVEPSYTGGISIIRYDLWIDNGSGEWPSTPISFIPSILGSTYQNIFTLLKAGGNYLVRVVAVNNVGSSIPSEVSYFVCADKPTAPLTPILESTTITSISIAWN